MVEDTDGAQKQQIGGVTKDQAGHDEEDAHDEEETARAVALDALGRSPRCSARSCRRRQWQDRKAAALTFRLRSWRHEAE